MRLENLLWLYLYFLSTDTPRWTKFLWSYQNYKRMKYFLKLIKWWCIRSSFPQTEIMTIYYWWLLYFLTASRLDFIHSIIFDWLQCAAHLKLLFRAFFFSDGPLLLEIFHFLDFLNFNCTLLCSMNEVSKYLFNTSFCSKIFKNWWLVFV